VVDSKLLFSMSEYLTHMPLRIGPTLTANMNVRIKRREYEERVREVEHASFNPLVFSTSGGMGASTTVAYKRLSFLLSAKWKTPYGRVMSWLRCRLGFSQPSCALGAPPLAAPSGVMFQPPLTLHWRRDVLGLVISPTFSASFEASFLFFVL